MSESHVERQVRERIEAVRIRAEQERRRRAAFAAARERGLGFRHAAKLRRLAESGRFNGASAASGA